MILNRVFAAACRCLLLQFRGQLSAASAPDRCRCRVDQFRSWLSAASALSRPAFCRPDPFRREWIGLEPDRRHRGRPLQARQDARSQPDRRAIPHMSAARFCSPRSGALIHVADLLRGASDHGTAARAVAVKKLARSETVVYSHSPRLYKGGIRRLFRLGCHRWANQAKFGSLSFPDDLLSRFAVLITPKSAG